MGEKVKRGVPAQRTKVSRKNQITLPVAALADAQVRSGDVLRVEVIAEGVFRLVRERGRFDALAGAAPGVSTVIDLDDERDEWSR